MTPERLDPESPDVPFLWDMREASLGVLRFTRGRSPQQLAGDDDLRRPVERGIVIIGRAARLVSPDTRSAAPAIPWRRLIGAAALLGDPDDALDGDELWALTLELPELVRAISRLIPAEEDADLP